MLSELRNKNTGLTPEQSEPSFHSRHAQAQTSAAQVAKNSYSNLGFVSKSSV